MLNYFPWNNHFLGYVELFPLKEPHFWKICFFLLKCWICWIILPLVVPLAFHRPKIIQHIQHIQHFSRKKHIFWNIRSNMIQHIQHFSRKKHISSLSLSETQKVPRIAEIEHFFKKSSPFCRNSAILSAHFENAPFPFAQIWVNRKKAFFTIKLG